VPTFNDYWLGRSRAWVKVAQTQKQKRKFSACTLRSFEVAQAA